MEPPENDPWTSLGKEGFADINNLDNARMALRWAMERIRGLEKANEETSKKLEWQIKMRLKIEEDLKLQWENEKQNLEGSLGSRLAAMEKEYILKNKECDDLLAKLEARLRALPPAIKEHAAPPPALSIAPAPSSLPLRSLWQARMERLARLISGRAPDFSAPPKPVPTPIALPNPPAAPPPAAAPPAPKTPQVQPVALKPASAPPPSPAVDYERERVLAREVYARALSALETVAARGWSWKPEAADPLSGALQECLGLLRSRNRALLSLTAVSSRENYLLCHGLNTAILSMEMGLGLGFPPEATRVLGLAGLTLDPLRLGLRGGGTKAGLALPGEGSESPLHLFDPGKVSSHITEASDVLKLTMEFCAASGAPPEFAAPLLTLCDLYEALSHPRAWRRGLAPHEAVMKLAKVHMQDFGRPLLRAFLSRVSIYPPGSFVKLSGGEVASVASVNPENFSLSLIEILVQHGGKPQHPPLILSLNQNPSNYIVEAVNAAEIKTTDPRILGELQARIWRQP